ncbi:MAG: Response regulator rcp1 [Chroococcidiopsis sp. SAG 2025]|uniref:response regulator n=1 Tax=Chroococcidiopsis sp. SAG 2025 TaxID=171389 RepID=UPI002936DC26|nr:response regulator [Chroococcidiopsis sp. SAG 2025]MDV2993848.1 Response regulator rcp1 [Chroococcidiopsis sp. SAG 2025]
MSKKLILLVEDNRDDEELTLMAFERSGLEYEIDVVRDGAEVLDYLFLTGKYSDRYPKQQPTLVLLDLNLPKVSGLEVIRRLRAEAKTRSLPVVVLTTSNEQEDMINSYELGCNSYVRKPVNFTDFLVASRQLGLYWLHLNEFPPCNSYRE